MKWWFVTSEQRTRVLERKRVTKHTSSSSTSNRRDGGTSIKSTRLRQLASCWTRIPQPNMVRSKLSRLSHSSRAPNSCSRPHAWPRVQSLTSCPAPLTPVCWAMEGTTGTTELRTTTHITSLSWVSSTSSPSTCQSTTCSTRKWSKAPRLTRSSWPSKKKWASTFRPSSPTKSSATKWLRISNPWTLTCDSRQVLRCTGKYSRKIQRPPTHIEKSQAVVSHFETFNKLS